MASAAAAAPIEPTHVTVSRETRRLFVGNSRPLNFGSLDEPDLITVPEGVTALTLQNRLCGDYYAEIQADKACRSAVADTPKDATLAAFAQVSK